MCQVWTACHDTIPTGAKQTAQGRAIPSQNFAGSQSCHHKKPSMQAKHCRQPLPSVNGDIHKVPAFNGCQ